MKSTESRLVEDALRTKFPKTDAYRYNSASIRVRVVDPRFSGMSHEKRVRMVEPILETLPLEIQTDIMNLYALTPEEMNDMSYHWLRNREFEDPAPSEL
jgi:stress-induced morphogen